MREWSKNEENFLRKNFMDRTVSVHYISVKLNRSESSVRGKANLLGLKRLGRFDIDDYILRNIDRLTIEQIAKDTNRSTKTIRRRAIKIKAMEEYNFRIITTKEVSKVVSRYANENTFILAAELSMPVHAIRKIAKRYNVKKNRVKSHKKKKVKVKRWSEEEKFFLINNCKNMTLKEMSKHLSDRNIHAIKGKINHLGIKDYLKIYTAGNIAFKYNTEYEKNNKLEYITSFRNLLSREKFEC